MRKLITSVALTVVMLSAASPAMAWGAREQGIVTGVVGAVIVQQLMQPRVIVAAPPPPPLYIVNPGYPPRVVPYYPGMSSPDFIHRPMYRSVDIFIPECNCYRTIEVRVN